MKPEKPENTDQYIAQFPDEIQQKLSSIREAVKTAAPEAEEVLSYGLPALKQGKVLVYYSANKSHIGFYPTPSGISAFLEELKGLKHAKGSVQFPYNRELPLDLIAKMTEFRVREESQ